MQIYVTLEAGAGILDSLAIDTGDNDPTMVSRIILAALNNADWTLAPGDTIKITERD